MAVTITTDWEARVGRVDIRASCTACGRDLVPARSETSAYKPYVAAVCPACARAPMVALCLSVCNWKWCCREKGHEGFHLSPTGTAWRR